MDVGNVNDDVFEYGVSWYPEWDDESKWRSELDDIVGTGFNVVRIGEFAWERFEPTPGDFDFSLFDEVMAELERRGIGVIFGIDTVRPPEWVFELHPDIHLTDEWGRFAHKRWPRHCSNHPAFRPLSSRLIEQVVTRYRSSPSLRYYQIDNEPSLTAHSIGGERVFCYCAHCQSGFADWLVERYAGRTAPVIAVPFPGQPEMGELAWLEWRLFQDESVRRRVRWVRDEVKRLDPDHAVTTNVMVGSGFTAGTSVIAHDVFGLIGDMDIVGMDHYANMSVESGEMDSLTYSISDQLSRGAGFHCLETQATTYGVEGGGWNGQNAGMIDFGPAERVVAQFWRTVAYGAKSVLYWVWRLRNENVWSLARPDGSLVPAAQVVRSLARDVERVWPQIEQAQRIPARVAIVFNRSSEHVAYLHGARDKGNSHSRDLIGKNGREVLNAFSAARRHAASVDVLDLAHLDTNLGSYDVVIAPFLHVVSHKEAQMLERFVEDGGTLVWGGRGGAYGEPESGWEEVSAAGRQVLPVDNLLPQFYGLLGFRPQGSFLLPDIALTSFGDALPVMGPVAGGGWYRSVVLDGGEVVATTTAGEPGIVHATHGAGETWAVLVDAFSAFDQGLTELLAQILQGSGVPADAVYGGLDSSHEIVRRTTPGGELIFLINSTGVEWDASTEVAAGNVSELLTGMAVDSRPGGDRHTVGVTVPAYGASILLSTQ